jgi:hypothetical protein
MFSSSRSGLPIPWLQGLLTHLPLGIHPFVGTIFLVQTWRERAHRSWWLKVARSAACPLPGIYLSSGSAQHAHLLLHKTSLSDGKIVAQDLILKLAFCVMDSIVGFGIHIVQAQWYLRCKMQAPLPF